MQFSILELFIYAIWVALEFHFKRFLRTFPPYSLDKKNYKVVRGALG